MVGVSFGRSGETHKAVKKSTLPAVRALCGVVGRGPIRFVLLGASRVRPRLCQEFCLQRLPPLVVPASLHTDGIEGGACQDAMPWVRKGSLVSSPFGGHALIPFSYLFFRVSLQESCGIWHGILYKLLRCCVRHVLQDRAGRCRLTHAGRCHGHTGCEPAYTGCEPAYPRCGRASEPARSEEEQISTRRRPYLHLHLALRRFTPPAYPQRGLLGFAVRRRNSPRWTMSASTVRRRDTRTA